MPDQNNEITTDSQAQQEALAAYLPPAGFVFPLKDGQTSTTFSPLLWATILSRYAAGESLIEIASHTKTPPSLIMTWATLPGLAPLYDQARRANARMLVEQASYATRQLVGQANVFQNGIGECGKNATHGKTAPTEAATCVPWSDKYAAAAIDRGGRLALEVATKLSPDEFSDRLQLDKRSVSAVYVVAYDSGQQIGHEPASIDVSAIPAPDKAGVERAALSQIHRRAIAKERKLKLKQLATD